MQTPDSTITVILSDSGELQSQLWIPTHATPDQIVRIVAALYSLAASRLWDMTVGHDTPALEPVICEARRIAYDADHGYHPRACVQIAAGV